MKYLICLVFGILLIGCDKPVIEEPTEPEEEIDVFVMEWATRIEPDRSLVTSNDLKHYEDVVIKTGDDEVEPTAFHFLDKLTGELEEKIVFSEAESVGEIFDSALFEHMYIGNGREGAIVGFDLDNRSITWRVSYEDLNASYVGIYKVEDRLQVQTISEEEDFPRIYEIDPFTGQVSDFFRIDSIGTFSDVTIYNGPEFEGEVAFMSYYPQLGVTPPQEARQDMIAVDVASQEILWRTADFTEKFPCNYQLAPVIYEDIVIIGGDWSMYAFDIKTGEQLWRTEINPDGGVGTFIRTEHLIHDDRLYVNSLVHPLACLNPLTGEILWINQEAPNCSRNMVYNEEYDLLMMGSIGKGSVLIFDALTGELVYQERKYEDSSYIANVIYDPETDMYFCNTFDHTMGFKLNYSR